MKVKIARWGNSLGLRLPKAVAEAAGLVEGSEIEIVTEGGEVRLRPAVPFKRYRLADLVSDIRRAGRDNEPSEVTWGPDRGAEILEEDAYSRGDITVDDLIDDAARKR